MSNNFEVFTAGFIAGAVVLVTILSLVPSTCSQSKAAIAACEKGLPRNQHCTLVGVPK